MSSLSVMILCGRSPRHLHVANVLARNCNCVGIVHERGREWTARKLWRTLKPASLARKAWRAVRDRSRYADGSEARFFFGDRLPRLERPELVIEVPHINHPSLIERARRLRPDLVAVFGSSLLRGATLGMGRLGMVNLHGGLSPWYRGADCTFWALYNNEPARIGCTLHYIDAGIDTGRLIAHICPEVREGDDELELFYRGVKESAEVYSEFLDRLERGERYGQVQREKGRLYQVRQRGWRHERDLARRLREGMLRGVQLPRRVTWFSVADDRDSPSRA